MCIHKCRHLHNELQLLHMMAVSRTNCMAQLIASYMLTQPGPYTVVAITPGKRAGSILAKWVMTYLLNALGKEMGMVTQNQLTVTMKGVASSDDERVFEAKPGVAGMDNHNTLMLNTAATDVCV